MSDERGEARPAERPSGIPDSKSEARRKTDDTPARLSLRPGALETKSERPQPGEPASGATPAIPRPPGLPHMTTSVRRRLQLVLEDDDPARASQPSIHPPKMEEPAFDAPTLQVARSLSRWIAFSGLLTLTVGALSGLSYLTGASTVAHVVVGILASALGAWLLTAARSFHRVASVNPSGKTRTPPDAARAQHLMSAFSLLRSALLLKAVLVFAALALSCVTFSLAASLLFLL